MKHPEGGAVRPIGRVRAGHRAIILALVVFAAMLHAAAGRKESAKLEDAPDVLLNLGNAELMAGEDLLAVERYRVALEQRHGWPEATNNLALALERTAQRTEALELWTTLQGNERFGPAA